MNVVIVTYNDTEEKLAKEAVSVLIKSLIPPPEIHVFPASPYVFEMIFEAIAPSCKEYYTS